MKNNLFNNLLLFSLFGIALGFFGKLYEGVVVAPKMLDSSMERMLFWHDFYSVINPIIFYIPLLPLATITLAILYFKTPKLKAELKKRLGLASIFQIVALALTFYIVTQINLKLYFGDVEKYADVIPSKTLLLNILSVVRLVFAAIALTFIFKAYTETQKAENI
jgi:hypothetical protein